MKQQAEEQFVNLLKQRAYELCGETPGMGDMEKALEVAALPFQREVLRAVLG